MKNNIDWVSVGKRIVSLRTINNMSRDRDRRIIRRKEKEEDFVNYHQLKQVASCSMHISSYKYQQANPVVPTVFDSLY